MNSIKTKKNIENIGLMDVLTGDEKIFMEGSDGEKEEINIPIEYFTEHELLDTAIRNLIIKYNNNPELMGKGRLENSKVSGFKICKDENGKKRMVFEYVLECNQYPDENDKDYEVRLKKHNDKVNKGKIKPYKVVVAEDYINDFGLKIKTTTLIDEIDRLIDEKVAKESTMINDELKNHKIDRNEWARKMQDLASDFPASGLEYMKDKMCEFTKYYEYITNHEGYKDMFKEEVMIATIAQDTVPKRRSVLLSDRENMEKVNEDIPFNERVEILNDLSPKKVISVLDDKTGEETYKAYIIVNKEDNGEIIVLEPIDGNKSTFITFENKGFIEFAKETLKLERGEEYRDSDVYKDFIGFVLRKTWSEKAKEDKIITKYHVSKESYERDLRYIVTGKMDKGIKIQSILKSKRDAMVR